MPATATVAVLAKPHLLGFRIFPKGFSNPILNSPFHFLGEESLLWVPVFCAKSSGCRKSQNYKQKQSISRHDANLTNRNCKWPFKETF